MNIMNLRICITTCFLLFITCVKGQELNITNDIKKFRNSIKQDANNELVLLKKIIPTAVMDIRYATTNNFTGEILYEPEFELYVRKPVAEALKKVQSTFFDKGFGIKIFDAYRPYNVTVKMWKLIGDERYVANPAKGSGHNRGISVDLTLIELATGNELDMGTGYDHFSDTAHHSFEHLPLNILENRQLLKKTMESHGFKALETEWWHYHFIWPKSFDVMNLKARQLQRMH